jgi:hypothetical protein
MWNCFARQEGTEVLSIADRAIPPTFVISSDAGAVCRNTRVLLRLAPVIVREAIQIDQHETSEARVIEVAPYSAVSVACSLDMQ